MILYGRGAAALAREISKMTGKVITTEDCQVIIDAFAKTYSTLWAWLQKNMDSAVENEYVECASGRRRYFTGVSQMSSREQAAARREASNSPIQGSVADLLASAGVMLYEAKKTIAKELRYKILLPIHDAFLIEVHKADIKQVIHLIKCCMSTWNKLPGTNYSLGVDIEVYKRWGDKPLKNY